MRMSRAATAASRTRIIAEAARRLRAEGVERASIAEIMRAAGMTQGGFYKHFGSKDELVAEAAAAAFAEAIARFDRRAAKRGVEAAAAAYAGDYLSGAHVAHPEQGCPLAALGADAGRGPQALTRAFAEGVEALIARHARAVGSRPRAIRRLLTLVGAVVAARAVGGGGALAKEILAAAAASRGDEP